MFDESRDDDDKLLTKGINAKRMILTSAKDCWQKRTNSYLALYDNKQEAIGISDLDDSDNSAKDCDTDDIIENMPITSISNPVPILQPELPDV
ncbi:14510_t:CDS:2, partial [Rhizophagus irregularis]